MFKFCREIHQTEHGIVHFQGRTTSIYTTVLVVVFPSHNDVRPKPAEHIGGHVMGRERDLFLSFTVSHQRVQYLFICEKSCVY